MPIIAAGIVTFAGSGPLVPPLLSMAAFVIYSGNLVRPGKAGSSVGVSPTGVEVRNPLAWVVSVEETKRRKPTDKAIFGMVSESPGRNASEPTGGLETDELRRPSPLGWGEGSMA